MQKKDQERTTWIIGSLLTLMLLPVIFIIGFALGAFYQGSMSLSQDTLSSWVSAIATISITVLTFVLARETWKLRKIQLTQIEGIRKDAIRPSVDFILKFDTSSLNLMLVDIVNNGSGSAHDIAFNFSGYNDNKEVYNYVETEFMKLNIIKNGILSLGTNEKRSSHVINFHELHSKYSKDSFETKINIAIYYKDIEGKLYNSKANIDFSEYVGIHRIGNPPIHDIASSLKKMESDIKKISNATSFKRLEINTYNSRDREIEKKKQDEYYEQWEKKQIKS